MCLVVRSLSQEHIELIQEDHGDWVFEIKERTIMLWTILVVLLVLWALGFLGGFVTSNLIHLLLLVALVVLAINFLSGRR